MKKLKMFVSIILVSSVIGVSQDVTSMYYTHCTVITMSIEQPWNSTGVNVMQNDTFTVTIQGIAAPDGKTMKNTRIWIGPEGYGAGIAGSSMPLPGVAPFSVIGRLGQNGTPFYIGRGGSFVSTKSGENELFLGYNDEIFWDNYGYFVAFVTPSKTLTDVKENNNGPQIDKLSLSQNYPNPFNPSTRIKFSVPKISYVSIKIFDVNGREIKTLINEQMNKGEYTKDWNGRDGYDRIVSSGTYFYQIKVGEMLETKKMILIK